MFVTFNVECGKSIRVSITLRLNCNVSVVIVEHCMTEHDNHRHQCIMLKMAVLGTG